MTLLDPEQYDVAREQRRRKMIALAVVLLLVVAWAAYHFRHYPERNSVNKFFSALQSQNYEAAYALWFRDPDWKTHLSNYSQYPFNDFYRDWGPGGEWGLVKSFHVDCSLSPGSGVIVQVTVNARTTHAYVWVERSNRTLSFSPNEIECGNWWTWLTE